MLDKYEIPVVSGHNNPKKHREHAWVIKHGSIPSVGVTRYQYPLRVVALRERGCGKTHRRWTSTHRGSFPCAIRVKPEQMFT